MTKDDPGLNDAYALKTPEDSRRLYADWADTYDTGFAARQQYLLPQHVAAALRDSGCDGPVLDVGAGTGLVAEALGQDFAPAIDALDISAEMLAVAARKGLYRRCIEGDLTGRLDIEDTTYGAVVSAGTFTHGHVGPDALDELMRVARPEAHFVLSINAEHHEALGFAARFDALADRIAAYRTARVPIYGASDDPAHASDEALIVTFRKR
jgi:predicted TPR repeat methyltransferase